MTDDRCPAYGTPCEYVAKVEAQAAEIEKLREYWYRQGKDDQHQVDADRIEAQAAEIERLHRALRRYGRHLSMCDLYANSTRSCTCGLTDDLKWT